jgi:hypothetical protein
MSTTTAQVHTTKVQAFKLTTQTTVAKVRKARPSAAKTQESPSAPGAKQSSSRARTVAPSAQHAIPVAQAFNLKPQPVANKKRPSVSRAKVSSATAQFSIPMPETLAQLGNRVQFDTEPAGIAPAFKGIQGMNTGLLSRGLRWIQTRNLTQRSTNRLKVCATVALGEKRFVSLIECDGIQFLIGGGAANVAFLSQVPNTRGVSSTNFDAALERAR